MRESDGPIKGVTREARLYAIRELVRRAGVSREVLHSWRIDFEEGWTTLHLGTNRRLRFRNSSPGLRNDHFPSLQQTARASWTYDPVNSVRKCVPDFVIPFQDESKNSPAPIFRHLTDDCVEFDWDLPLVTLFTLSRMEESFIPDRDQHGRFSGSSSIAFRNGFLDRPIIDEYGLALEQAIRCLLPNSQAANRSLRVKLSHDIDLVGIPFRLREVLGHALCRRRPAATACDLMAGFTNRYPTFLALVQDVASMSLERGLDSAVYWKGSPPGPNDSGYDLRHQKIRKVISWLAEKEVECGIHPGYETFRSRERLLSEVEFLRTVLGKGRLGGRQHYLRWSPETWVDWESCGLAYDSSVGFADHIGFRAGTCYPYRPWIFSENREAQLLEIPLIMMDCTLTHYMGLTWEESLEAMKQCVETCRMVGGVFTLLWHNTSLIDPIYGDVYRKTLDQLTGTARFDWKAALKELQ
jgi:hypothetical protein